MLRRMILKMNKELINEQIKELGLEFWGILHFETDFKCLYNYLDANQMCLSMSTFVNWLIFPELIPADKRIKIRMKLMHRNEDPSYKPVPSKELTVEETMYHEQALEWLHYKYQASNASEKRFKHLYDMSEHALKQFLNSLVEYGYGTNETNFRYLQYYKLLQGIRYDK